MQVLAAQIFFFLFVTTDAPSAVAQTFPDVIGAARLDSGYSQIPTLTATPDISSAHLDISDGPVPQSLTLTRVPYEGSLLVLSDWNSIGWRISGGYSFKSYS